MNDRTINETVLDLEIVKEHILHRTSLGWTREKIEKIEIWYRRFLYIRLNEKEATLVPTNDIDEFWHIHILYTNKYYNDCKNIFSYIVQHNPIVQPNKEEDTLLKKNFNNSLKLFKKHYNEIPNIESGYALCDCDPGPTHIVAA